MCSPVWNLHANILWWWIDQNKGRKSLFTVEVKEHSIIVKWKTFGTIRTLPRVNRPTKASNRTRRVSVREVTRKTTAGSQTGEPYGRTTTSLTFMTWYWDLKHTWQICHCELLPKRLLQSSAFKGLNIFVPERLQPLISFLICKKMFFTLCASIYTK